MLVLDLMVFSTSKPHTGVSRRHIFNREGGKQDSLSGHYLYPAFTHSKIRSLIRFSFLSNQRLGVDMTKTINKTVNVTAMKFGKNFSAYPTRMELDGDVYTFVDPGLSLTIRSRGVVSKILILSDGLQQFRLRSDGRGGVWTLLSIGA